MRNREKLMEVTGSLGERDEARTAKDTVHQVNKRAFPRTRETHKEDSDDRRNIHIRLADSTGTFTSYINTIIFNKLQMHSPRI